MKRLFMLALLAATIVIANNVYADVKRYREISEM